MQKIPTTDKFKESDTVELENAKELRAMLLRAAIFKPKPLSYRIVKFGGGDAEDLNSRGRRKTTVQVLT